VNIGALCILLSTKVPNARATYPSLSDSNIYATFQEVTLSHYI